MQITTKELRIQPGKIIDIAAQGEEVTVTFRGKPMVAIVPLTHASAKPQTAGKIEDTPLFGIWSDQSESEVSVEGTVRNLRKGRFL